jgi:serine/threonine protein phosphatase PrpC
VQLFIYICAMGNACNTEGYSSAKLAGMEEVLDDDLESKELEDLVRADTDVASEQTQAESEAGRSTLYSNQGDSDNGTVLPFSEIGACSEVGWKPMEPNYINQDAYLDVKLSEHRRLLGVFDGHGKLGAQVSNRVRSSFAELGQELSSSSDVKASLEEIFAQACNQILSAGIGVEAGTTATLVLVDSLAQRLWTANVGDSTAVVFDARGSIAFQSEDHRPDIQSEAQRLLSYGTVVRAGRVPLHGSDADLGISRSIGDFLFAQQGVTAKPDIASAMFEPGSILLIASDGVWDVLSKDDVATLIKDATPQESAQRIVRDARAKWSSALDKRHVAHIDDITAVLVKSV